MVFAREVNGQELTFGVPGKLIMNALVRYDHQTESYWSQFLGRAVTGPFDKQRLELLPAQLTTWGAWKAQHDDTLALDKSSTRGGSSDPYARYYQSGSAGILGEAHRDNRLDSKELVVGLELGPAQGAYALRHLRERPVVNDVLGGDAIVVTLESQGGAASLFRRETEGRTLTFEPAPGVANGQPLMRDRETGTTWTTLSGNAVDGALAGSRLEQLPAFVVFWFAWTDFHPGTDLYQPGADSAA